MLLAAELFHMSAATAALLCNSSFHPAAEQIKTRGLTNTHNSTRTLTTADLHLTSRKTYACLCRHVYVCIRVFICVCVCQDYSEIVFVVSDVCVFDVNLQQRNMLQPLNIATCFHSSFSTCEASK